MWTSVLQATSLSIASIIVTHHLGSSVFQTVIDDEAFKAWQAMSDNFSTPTTSSTNGLLLSLGPEVNASVGSPTNATNGTQSANYTNNPLEKQPESFYGRKLPRETIIQFVLLMLRYYWLIYLEKLLPARPRKRGILPEGKEKFEESEDREEEVIQKWIAQGRIRRASLNWCNTSLKWILTLTVWRIFAFTCDHVLGGILQLESFQTIRSRYTRVSGHLHVPVTTIRPTQTGCYYALLGFLHYHDSDNGTNRLRCHAGVQTGCFSGRGRTSGEYLFHGCNTDVCQLGRQNRLCAGNVAQHDRSVEESQEDKGLAGKV